MKWHYKTFDQLNTSELYAILQLRSKVFVLEQNCPYLDPDNKDQLAIHLWCSDEQHNVVAYCRLLPAGISYDEPSIGRVVTAAEVRGQGMGRILMEQAMVYIRDNWDNPSVRISAQHYLQPFYESLAFVPVGDVYIDDWIPHIEMLFQPENSAGNGQK